MAFINASRAPFSAFLGDWAHYILAYVKEAKRRNAGNDVDKALRELSKFSDYELNDIGLTRGDLTPDGLAAAGARRSYFQSKIDAEHRERASAGKS